MDAATLRAQFDAGALDPFLRHPSQLYQAGLEGLALFAFLWWYSSKPRPRFTPSPAGSRCCTGVFRCAVEFVRARRATGYLAFGWLTMGQLLQPAADRVRPVLAVAVAAFADAAPLPPLGAPSRKGREKREALR